MLRRLTILAAAAIALPVAVIAQNSTRLTLDECRQMALQNNKQMQIGAEKVRAAGYQKKEARAAYFPSIDVNGGYMWNEKNISLFSSDQLLPIKTFDP
ncbi:MAG: TolC family protein, partial [Muribaculaceae bacterium]|nr:TolC family protein [Muribaculaceae bacterium]